MLTVLKSANSENFKYRLGKIPARINAWTSIHKMKAITTMPHSFPQKSNNLVAGISTGNLLWMSR